MIRRLTLPDSGARREGERRIAGSAERNIAAILDVLGAHAPQDGRALELASGTGQQIVRYAQAFPGLDWQPSDIDPDNLVSIRAWAVEHPAPNLREPVLIDAGRPGWEIALHPFDLIHTVNLLHLISRAEARTVVAEAALALAPGGRLVIYGPFLRDGVATSEGDARFHASLRAADPEVGYKDAADVADWLKEAGLSVPEVAAMPANNLAFVAGRPHEG